MGKCSRYSRNPTYHLYGTIEVVSCHNTATHKGTGTFHVISASPWLTFQPTRPTVPSGAALMPVLTCEWRQRSELMQHGGTISYNLTAVCERPVTHRVILPSWGGFDAATHYVCNEHAEEARRGHGKVEPL